MWIMLLLLPMPPIIGACLGALPRAHQRLPAAMGWTLLLPCLIGASVFLMPVMAGAKEAPTYTFVTILAALLCYFVIRGFTFVGLASSFRSYGKEKQLSITLAAAVLAWFLTIVEPLAVAAIFVLSFLIGYPGRFDQAGMTEVFYFLTGILLAGICLSYVFLFILNSVRRVAAGKTPAAAKPGAKVPASAKPAPRATPTSIKKAPAVVSQPAKMPATVGPKGPPPFHHHAPPSPPPQPAPTAPLTIPLEKWPDQPLPTPAPPIAEQPSEQLAALPIEPTLEQPLEQPKEHPVEHAIEQPVEQKE